jgi:predicted HTH transcriptional regulator
MRYSWFLISLGMPTIIENSGSGLQRPKALPEFHNLPSFIFIFSYKFDTNIVKLTKIEVKFSQYNCKLTQKTGLFGSFITESSKDARAKPEPDRSKDPSVLATQCPTQFCRIGAPGRFNHDTLQRTG